MARVGSKAIFDHTGKNIFGWIAAAAPNDLWASKPLNHYVKKKGRIVLADLDDEVFGLGVACGGKMEIFINPVLQIEEVTLQRTSGFDQVAKALAHHRKVSVKSLREVKDLPVTLGATP